MSTEETVAKVRQVMRRDDAFRTLVPSDLRVLVGEIDRLRVAAAGMEPGEAPGVERHPMPGESGVERHPLAEELRKMEFSGEQASAAAAELDRLLGWHTWFKGEYKRHGVITPRGTVTPEKLDAMTGNEEAILGVSPETVARWFHEEYERLAPEHGYETRTASAAPWSDVPKNNRELMIATAAEVLTRLEQERDPGPDDTADWPTEGEHPIRDHPAGGPA